MLRAVTEYERETEKKEKLVTEIPRVKSYKKKSRQSYLTMFFFLQNSFSPLEMNELFGFVGKCQGRRQKRHT